MPFRAALTFTSVPRKVIVASAVPSPAPVPFASLKLKLRPEVVLSVRVPLVAVSVTWMLFPPASRSATEIWLPLPLEKVSGVFCGVPCGPGTVFTGASLTAATLIVLGRRPYSAAVVDNEGHRAWQLTGPRVLLYLTERSAVW